MSRFEWGLLVLGLLLFIVVLYIPFPIPETVVSILFCVVLLIPTLYVLKGNWNLMFRKIRRKDIMPILIFFVLQFAYSMIVLYILETTGLKGPAPVNAETEVVT